MNTRTFKLGLFRKIRSEIKRFKKQHWDIDSLLEVIQVLRQHIMDLNDVYLIELDKQWEELQAKGYYMLDHDQQELTEEDYRFVSQMIEQMADTVDRAFRRA